MQHGVIAPQETAAMDAMPAVRAYREALQALQADWRNLGVLGQLTGAVAAMDGTRMEFQQLSWELLAQLARELRRKAAAALQSTAQVAIQTLVRNLFERTADVGFLATDAEIVRFLREREDAPALSERLAAYRSNYTVYFDVLLFTCEGEIALRLRDCKSPPRTEAALIGETLRSGAPYTEAFGVFDFLPGEESTLVYTCAVRDARSTPVGVLALCFRFADEMQRIFAPLLSGNDDTVGVLLDEQGTVVSSSEPFHIPPGARLPRLLGADGAVVTLRGSDYLVACRRAMPFQGYAGPPWRCAVLAPLRSAFRAGDARMDGLEAEVEAQLAASTTLFDEALRAIPRRAQAIQRELTRSVWNGSMQHGEGAGGRFSRVLCGEIGKVASQTRDVFTRSIADLQRTMAGGVLQESGFLAAQLADLLDRNLYERANDCRWWALDATIRGCLAAPEPDAAAIQAVLQRIHALYTVYTNLVVFDASGRVVAVSDPALRSVVGTALSQDWAVRTLRLRGSAEYAISEFEPTVLDGGEHATFVYAAAITSPDDARVTGGLAAVFDARRQLAGMLQDVVGHVPGASACFVRADGRRLAAQGQEVPPSLPAGVVRRGGVLHAAGTCRSPGYREYDGRLESARTAARSIVLLPLGAAEPGARSHAASCAPSIAAGTGADALEIATFRIGDGWYALRTADVVQATARQAPVAGGGRRFAGLQMHEGRPLPLFDLPVQEGAAGDRQEVVVVLAPGDRRFGLLVDELGSVLQVAPGERRDVPEGMRGAALVTDALLGGPDGMLQLLAVERIVAALGAGAPTALA